MSSFTDFGIIFNVHWIGLISNMNENSVEDVMLVSCQDLQNFARGQILSPA